MEYPLKMIFHLSSSIFREKQKKRKEKKRKTKNFHLGGSHSFGSKSFAQNLVTGRHFGEYNIIPNTKFILNSLALNHSIFLHSLTL